MKAHTIKISVFIKEHEDEDLILNKFKTFILVKKAKINKNIATGFDEKEIIILETILEKNKEINEFLNNFFQAMEKDQKKILIKQIDSRMDSYNNFYVRIDKDKFLKDKYIITDSGNCIHIKITVAAFPKTKDNAKKVIESIIQP